MAFSVRRSLAWMTVSQGGLVAMQFGASLVIARLLTPYETGVFAVAAAMAGLLGMLRTLGLSNYVIRAAALTPSFLAGVFTVNALLALLVALLIVGISLLGGALLGEPGVRDVLMVLALVPLLAALEFLPSARIERAGNFRAIAMVNLLRNSISTAAMLVLAFRGHSYMSLAYGQFAGAVVAMAAVNAVGWRHASLRLGLHGWREIARYGLLMLATSGVVAASMRAVDFVLGWMLGLHALGIYSRAAGLVMMLWENFCLVMTRVVFVDLVEQRRRGLSFRTSYLHVLFVATGVLWPAFAGLAVLSGPALLTLYGPQWVDGAIVLSLLSVALMLSVLALMTWEMFVALDETARLARFQAAQSLVGLAAFTTGCLGGVAGAAAARIAEAAFGVVLCRPHLARMTDTRLIDCWPALWRGAALTVLAVAPAAMVMIWYDWAPTAPLAAVLPAMAAGVAAWAAGLRLLGHPLYRELIAVLQHYRPALGTQAK